MSKCSFGHLYWYVPILSRVMGSSPLGHHACADALSPADSGRAMPFAQIGLRRHMGWTGRSLHWPVASRPVALMYCALVEVCRLSLGWPNGPDR
jgi:hypothetical protein